jgi:hypothetical protein
MTDTSPTTENRTLPRRLPNSAYRVRSRPSFLAPASASMRSSPLWAHCDRYRKSAARQGSALPLVRKSCLVPHYLDTGHRVWILRVAEPIATPRARDTGSSKNPAASAVTREAEEDWSKERGR